MDIKAELKQLMLERNYSLTDVATRSGVGRSTINMFMNDKYDVESSTIIDKIYNFIQIEKERGYNKILKISEISILKYIFEIAGLCHKEGAIGVCIGEAGLGKTIAVKEYLKQNPNAILIESDSGYTVKSLLLDIHKRLGLSGKGTCYELKEKVIDKLNQSGRLLIIDEAENLPTRVLEIARRIHDKTGIGLLLVGKSELYENLIGYKKQYDQLYSRVEYYKSLKKIQIKDVEKIVEAAGQDPKLATAYLQYSDGNTRKLSHLIHSSTRVAFNNSKTEVDSAVILQTSKLLMA